MNKNHGCFTTRAMVIAVQGALLAMAAMQPAFADEETDALTQPAKTIEVGVRNANTGSYKAGEYDGLQKKGATANVNLDVRGGGRYDSEDVARWRITGTDLGLETRNLSAEYGQQGKFRVSVGYDELLRNRSDSYQTPYNGAGSNSLTLPSNWIVPIVPQNSGTSLNARSFSSTTGLAPGPYTYAGGVWTPTAATAGNTTAVQNIQAADLPAFHNVNISTKRKKFDVGIQYNIDNQFSVMASMRREKKDGLQLMGTVSRVQPSTGGSVTDASVIIPYLIDQNTEQFNASLNFKNENSFVQAAYYGSFYKDNVPSMSWQNWQTGTTVAGGTGVATAHSFTTTTESTAPDNQFHQFSLAGGYDFSKTTKLAANASIARNTQNQAFLTDSTTVVVPQTSLNGLVVTKAFSLKLTTKPTNDLKLAANYKFDQRDNRTAVNIYQYADASEPATVSTLFTGAGVSAGAPAVLAQNANANRPYSKKVNQFGLDADYRVMQGHAVKVGYDLQKTERYCNGSWIGCVDAATTKDNTLKAEWRATLLETLTGKLGYAYTKRTISNYNENAFLALVPYANVVPIGATMSAYQYMLANGLNGFGPMAGYAATSGNAAAFFGSNNALANAAYANNNRISELPGMRRYNMADRNSDKLRSSLNWQATEQFSMQAGLNYSKDDYVHTTYGLKDGKSLALNLDGTYAASDSLSFTAYYSNEDKRSHSAGNNYATNSNTTNVNNQTAVVDCNGVTTTIQIRNNGNKMDPCENWTMDMHDQVDTLGFNVKQSGLLSGKLEVAGDITYSYARTNYGATGGVYVNNPYAVSGVPAATISAAYWIPAQALPEVTTKTTDLKVSGKYLLDKQSAVQVGYRYQKMSSTDYAYSGMQYGSVATVLPSNEQSPVYTVHTIGASYIYNLK